MTWGNRILFNGQIASAVVTAVMSQEVFVIFTKWEVETRCG